MAMDPAEKNLKKAEIDSRLKTGSTALHPPRDERHRFRAADTPLKSNTSPSDIRNPKIGDLMKATTLNEQPLPVSTGPLIQAQSGPSLHLDIETAGCC